MSDPTTLAAPSRRSTRVRSALNALVTIGVIGGSAGIVVAGQRALSAQRADLPPIAAAPTTTVRVATLRQVDRYTVERRFAGQFEPPQRIAQGFEEGGTIAAVLVDEGDRVRAGEVLARLDTALLDAERIRLQAAARGIRAQVELARRTNARKAELRQRGFATDQTVDDTSLGLVRLEAALTEAEAALQAVDVRLGKAVIRAPFDGVVGRRRLDDGAVAGPGAPVLDLLQDGPVQFRAGLAPDVADRLAVGDPVTVEAAGAVWPARVDRIAPDLDPATRARVVQLRVEAATPPPARAAGTVVVATDRRADPTGAWIPLAALRQGEAGTWEIMTVADGRIATEAVEIVHAEAARAFVTGTFPPDAPVVAGGPHRVVPGEPVRIEREDVAWAR